jgi:hypothetical protein
VLLINDSLAKSRVSNIMSLFGKSWRKLLSFGANRKEKISIPTRETAEIGDMVIFCKNPPADKDHCNVWQRATGMVIDIDTRTNEASILSDGEIYTIKDEWVGPINLFESPEDLK